jgi:hypothetical protein
MMGINTKTTSHIPGELNEGVQRCVMCGEIIQDIRNIMYIGDPPSGWEPGIPVYFTKNSDGIVTDIYSRRALPNNLAFMPCNENGK